MVGDDIIQIISFTHQKTINTMKKPNGFEVFGGSLLGDEEKKSILNN